MLDVERYLGALPVPDYCDPVDLLAEALPTLKPPRRIDVPDWAAKERRLRTPSYSGPWKNDFAPYMVEPSQMTTSRRFGAVAFTGPARTVKSDSLILNTFGHRVCCMPREMKIICPTEATAKEFSRKKVSPMIRATPTVAERQLPGRSADALHDKQFRGGMNLRIAWPVIGELSMFDIPDMLLTDYDRMVDDVGGEGSPFDLSIKRNQTFGSMGMTIVEGSPGRPILNPDFKASTPHEAPPATGIMAIYNQGTRGRFYWTCPSCNEPFQPLFDRLEWETKDTPGESAKTVVMTCPNGCVIEVASRNELNRSGFWLHESGQGEPVEIDDPNVRDTEIVSYWCEGPVAVMQGWEQLVARYLRAKEEFETKGDEQALKTTVNVDQGKPYLPKVMTIGDGLSDEMLRALAQRFPMKMATAPTRFLTVQVDIQANRFVVQVDAWGVGLERWLIDRFDLMVPPELAPGGQRDASGNAARSIDPGRYAEDWEVLSPLLERYYPVAGGEYEIRPAAMIIDSGGQPGVTDNAYLFLRRQKKAGNARRVFLVKGQGGLDKDRARFGQPQKMDKRRRTRRTDIELVYAGTDLLKDEIALSLTRKDPGPGAYHLPEQLPDHVFEEFCAEVRMPGGWEKKRHGIRNEALDLAVYGKALTIVLKADKIPDWDQPPAFARPLDDNTFSRRTEGQEMEEVDAPVKRTPRRKRKQNYVARGMNGGL
ncbi:MAG: terminase [Rhizobiaceae bacterium MnEN-MB40S]|nr:MAG: terminase [Rhizobiaceae bacterium MnEN-MB40S]